RWVAGLAGDEKGRITIAHLLAHTAGFPALIPGRESFRTRDDLMRGIAAVELVYRPGQGRIYDDIGFILLGLIAARVTGLTFDRSCADNIFAPLGMTDTMFVPPPSLHNRVAPTEVDESRGGLLHAVVHDEKAGLMGGVAGHAGMFSTARDLLRFCRIFLPHP